MLTAGIIEVTKGLMEKWIALYGPTGAMERLAEMRDYGGRLSHYGYEFWARYAQRKGENYV